MPTLTFPIAFALALATFSAPAHTLDVQLSAAPAGGSLIAMLFDSPEGFENFRVPFDTRRVPADGRDRVTFENIPPGHYALMVFHDENDNRRLDVNVFGIPREPIGFSNAYAPKGPPAFERARFTLATERPSPLQITLAHPLGRRGRLGIGAGVIARGSPYAQSTGNPLVFLPAVTYIGRRVRILGPHIQVGLSRTDAIRVAVGMTLRMGAYDEDDSPMLAGMGNRRTTAMAGLHMQINTPFGTGLGVSYAHDALNRIGGGEARLQLERPIPWRRIRLTPSLSLNWNDQRLVHHDVGVPGERATPGRPAYRPGSAISLEPGIGVFTEITGRLLLTARISVEGFDHNVRRSPIVDKHHVLKGMAFITWML